MMKELLYISNSHLDGVEALAGCTLCNQIYLQEA